MALFDETTELNQPRSSAIFLRHRNHILSHLHNTGSSGTGHAGTTGAGVMGGSPAAGTGGSNVKLGGLTFVQLQALIVAIQGGQVGGGGPVTTTTGSTTANTIEKRWAVNLDTLLKLRMVPDVASLTPVWEALARGPRKEERQILQVAITD